MRSIKEIIRAPSAIGIIVGLLLLGASLTPSLIPRTWTQQAVIAALSFISGYGIGVALYGLWRYLELPVVAEERRGSITILALVVAAVLLAYFLFRSLGWQNSVRATVGLEPVDTAYPLRMVTLALALSAFLLLFFRFLWWIGATVFRLVSRFVPRRVGQVIGLFAAVILVIMLLNGLLLQTVSDALNSTYALTDSGTHPNVYQPTSALRSGSPDSLIAWETLGKEGRRFTGTGPTAEEIAEFRDGAPAEDPIRVYVGAKSAATLEARAQLALDELIRTGAFERDVLVLVTSTGNGWVDSNAINSLEYIFGGDTAIAAFQYSYLPSVYALLADKSSATDASVAMFNRIHDHWQQLDPEDRPEFYLHGLSLGAYGSQAAVSSVAQFNDPVNGALWAGPPFVSEFWRRLTRDREAGTPVWRPVYQDGRTIRFTNMGEGLDEAPDIWQENRFVYLQQAGDPIVFFEPDSLYRVPEWLRDESRSPKAPPEMTWIPVATFWQLVFDMVLGTSDALPDGNGHRYGSDSYIDAWVALTQPDNWSAEQTEQLKALFDALGNPNKP